MFVGGGGVLVPVLAVLVSRFGVLPGLFVLAEIVMMGRLMVVMGRGVVMSGGLVMMLLAGCFGDFAMAFFLQTGQLHAPVAASIWGAFGSQQPLAGD